MNRGSTLGLQVVMFFSSVETNERKRLQNTQYEPKEYSFLRIGPSSTRKVDDDVHSFFEPRCRNRLTFRRNQSHIVAVSKDENSRRLLLVDTGIPLAEAACDDISLPHIFLFPPNNNGPINFFRSTSEGFKSHQLGRSHINPM